MWIMRVNNGEGIGRLNSKFCNYIPLLRIYKAIRDYSKGVETWNLKGTEHLESNRYSDPFCISITTLPAYKRIYEQADNT